MDSDGFWLDLHLALFLCPCSCSFSFLSLWRLSNTWFFTILHLPNICEKGTWTLGLAGCLSSNMESYKWSPSHAISAVVGWTARKTAVWFTLVTVWNHPGAWHCSFGPFCVGDLRSRQTLSVLSSPHSGYSEANWLAFWVWQIGTFLISAASGACLGSVAKRGCRTAKRRVTNGWTWCKLHVNSIRFEQAEKDGWENTEKKIHYRSITAIYASCFALLGMSVSAKKLYWAFWWLPALLA